MKSHLFPHPSAKAKGFTLLELMVAMSVTVILLGMVTFMTGVSMDGYKGSRDKVVAGRQAKEALDAITKDFEAMVARADGSDNMWLYAEVEPNLSTALGGPAGKTITNAPRLIFFTGAPDRYDGEIGGTNDNGGDVSALSYRLAYRDQISGTAANAVGAFPSFTLYRHLVDPDATFTNVLGFKDTSVTPPKPDISKSPELTDALDFTAENVIAENIYEMTVTFMIQVTLVHATKPDIPYVLRVTIKDSDVSDFSVSGNGLSWDGTIRLPEDKSIQPTTSQVTFNSGDLNGYVITPEIIEAGQLVGVEIGMTVLSERGLVMTEKGGMTREDIIKDYGIHYTHTVNVPRF